MRRKIYNIGIEMKMMTMLRQEDKVDEKNHGQIFPTQFSIFFDKSIHILIESMKLKQMAKKECNRLANCHILIDEM